MEKMKKFRDSLLVWLKNLSINRLPNNVTEFIELAELHRFADFSQEDSEDLREWIFDLCKESGRYTLTEDGSDLRIKA